MKLFSAYFKFCQSVLVRLCRATGLSNFFFARCSIVAAVAFSIAGFLGYSPIYRFLATVEALVIPIALWYFAGKFEQRLESKPNAVGLELFNAREFATLSVSALMTFGGGAFVTISAILHREFISAFNGIGFEALAMSIIFILCVTPPRAPHRKSVWRTAES